MLIVLPSLVQGMSIYNNKMHNSLYNTDSTKRGILKIYYNLARIEIVGRGGRKKWLLIRDYSKIILSNQTQFRFILTNRQGSRMLSNYIISNCT